MTWRLSTPRPLSTRSSPSRSSRPPPVSQTQRLRPAAKAWRAVALLTMTALFLGGTTVGDDDWWPFSPWRMFSTSTSPNGAVRSTFIQVRTAEAPQTWAQAPINPDNVGLNRAEVEGNLDRIARDPAMLGTLAGSHAKLRPDAPAWIGIRVVIRNYLLKGGGPTGEYRDDLVAEWSAS